MQGYPYSHENPQNAPAWPAIEKFNDIVKAKNDIHRVLFQKLYNIYRYRSFTLFSKCFKHNYRDFETAGHD